MVARQVSEDDVQATATPSRPSALEVPSVDAVHATDLFTVPQAQGFSSPRPSGNKRVEQAVLSSGAAIGPTESPLPTATPAAVQSQGATWISGVGSSSALGGHDAEAVVRATSVRASRVHVQPELLTFIS